MSLLLSERFRIDKKNPVKRGAHRGKTKLEQKRELLKQIGTSCKTIRDKLELAGWPSSKTVDLHDWVSPGNPSFTRTGVSVISFTAGGNEFLLAPDGYLYIRRGLMHFKAQLSYEKNLNTLRTILEAVQAL